MGTLIKQFRHVARVQGIVLHVNPLLLVPVECLCAERKPSSNTSADTCTWEVALPSSDKRTRNAHSQTEMF